MRRSGAFIALLVAAMVGASATPAGAAAPAYRYNFLAPGGQPRLTETVPVNVVFVGYEPGQVGAGAFKGELAKKYEPVVRSRLAYDVVEKLGITYKYDYRLTYADRAYENKFFNQLGKLAKPAPLTEYQEAYNTQAGVLDVTANHTIDAPSVEKYLAFHPPSGVDTRRNTVYFINWHGRSDFKFHVYTKTGEPDPDTGYDFGASRDSRKMIAWGGTTADDEETGLGATRRVWFHDLSAGPESWTENYDVTNADVDGDGEPDYRMPPIWEYAAGGYRTPAALAGDLGKITRYVALNLLMTTSPLYPVELPTTEPPRSINIDANTYEGWPGLDASARYVKPKLVVKELSELRWRNKIDYDNQDFALDAKNRACYDGFVSGESCYPGSGLPSDANLFLYNRDNLARTKDDGNKVDYELPVFNYVLPPDVDPPLLGFADDDWQTGTQSYVFNFLSQSIVESGYGLSTTTIHEVGHHLGMSHPHDGWDSETGVDYAPTGPTFFAWAGDENNSMMSYIDVNWDFSQFDRDNSNRFLTAAYWEAANRLAATIPNGRSRGDLAAADALLGLAKVAFAKHDYRAAYTLAEGGYNKVVAAAKKSGVDPSSAARAMAAEADAERAKPDVKSPHEFIDTLDPQGPRAQP
ncbi:hypothetical protein [Paractinoplanes brasiliensis]|uniref:Peptidase M43 pregnancy-associated plasma-A domain-containing protein n=1 Tax=Paractinoplanes brasiliensis TaxID=52695 RepID=A0A4R6J9H3_9ACTN|nr:hypothetical protein [Actinoplanes brasiliensis]TDO32132.1 hypothetical protein C8E87_7577 [Actinoplanes brasiliensis]